jgi:hypothetical protein
MYVSEVTEFLRNLKQNNPHIEAEQKKGRAIWWDKEPASLARTAQIRESTIPQQGYVYQIKG